MENTNEIIGKVVKTIGIFILVVFGMFLTAFLVISLVKFFPPSLWIILTICLSFVIYIIWEGVNAS